MEVDIVRLFGKGACAIDEDEWIATKVRLGLRELLLEDREEFERAFALLNRPISDYSFASLWMWAETLGVAWGRIDGHLCVFSDDGRELMLLLPPIPAEEGVPLSATLSCVRRCFEIMDGANADRHGVRVSRMEYVSDELLERIRDAGETGLGATAIWGDYVYDTRRMIDLAGGDLKSKRRARNHFLKAYPNHTVEEFREEDAGECLGLLGLWQHVADTGHEGQMSEQDTPTKELRDRERRATERAILHAGRIGLRGLVLRVEGRVVAFTLGERLSASQASVLVEKAHPEYDGAAQVIFSAFCGRVWGEYPEINAGDDWGIPSLRFTKETYRPSRMLNKCVLGHAAVVPAVEVPVRNPPHTVVSLGSLEDVEGGGGVEIREARLGDVGAVHELERLCFDEGKESFNLRQIRGLVQNERSVVLLAEIDGRVIGWAVGLVRRVRHAKSGGEYRLGRLYSLATHPEQRGRGVARALATRILEELAARGAQRVVLEVRSNNEAAIALYRDMGFVEVKRLAAYYGAGRDGLRMARAGSGE